MEIERRPEDVIPFVLTLVIAAVLVLAMGSSIRAVTLAEQCGPSGLAATQGKVDAILSRTVYRVETPDGGELLPQDARLTRVQLRALLTSPISECAEHLGPFDGSGWHALASRVAAEIDRRQ